MKTLATAILVFVSASLIVRSLTPLRAAGSAYYVATTGNDSNPGTQSLPFGTINKGAGILQPGDTLYVRSGTYNQTVSIDNSGTASAPITVASYPGESAVIDGQDTIPGYWGVLVSVNGNYVVVRDLEVKNSAWMGLFLHGQFDQALHINAHHNMENGILIDGNNALVENSDVWWNAKSHEYGVFKSGHGPTWATGLTASRHPQHATLRRNRVWNNWGEALSTYEAEYTTMEDNVVYDNWINVYVSDTKYTVVQRNMVYCTPSSPMNGTGADQVGILLGDETSNPASSDNQFTNNVVKGCNGNFYYWGSNLSGGLVNDLIAYNTLSDTSGSRGNLQINNGTHSNTRITNNIIEQTNSMDMAILGSPSGLSFSNNLWSRTPPSGASGTGDVIGDPKLVKIGPTGAGQLTPQWFTILFNSPARDRGAALSNVVQDFFGVTRGPSPDIGADEYVGVAPPAPPAGLRVT